MNILILDDDQGRLDQFKQKLVGHSIVTTKTAKGAIKEIKKGKWDYIFLDHDLAEEHTGTGLDVAKFLSENIHLAPKKMIVVHSYNPIGATNIENYVKDLPCEVIKAPGIWIEKIID